MPELVKTENQTPATSNTAAAYRELADEAGGAGDLLKFKRGKFFKGKDEEEVPLGACFACNMAGLARGFIKFNEDSVEKAMAHPGEPPLVREAMGDTDEVLWPKDDNGIAQDPWTPTWELPLKNIETGEELTFATSSTGGINTLGRVCAGYGNQLAIGNTAIPIVELGASSYRHKRFGTVDVPVLRIIEWKTEQQLVSGDEAEVPPRPARPAAEQLDDEIPF